MGRRFIVAAMVACLGTTPAGGAAAQMLLFAPETIHGVIDLRASAADGERSFTDGGFGKTRYGGAGTGLNLQVSNATLEWTPRLSWELSAVVDAIAQPDQEHAVDLSQAYIQWKPVPTSSTRMAVRAGLYYPAISLEHDFRAWGVTDTITPSAINSWVGEELKVVGVEGTVTRKLGEQEVSATAGVFAYDDTAGTLLSFRGWALDDMQSQANGSFPLPPLSKFVSHAQDGETYPTIEIDHHAGLYGRVEWRPTDALSLNAFYYDNRGDMLSKTVDKEWAWATQFWNLGARWDPDDKTKVLAQAMTGRTAEGFVTRWGRLVDMDFRAAYLLATRTVGANAFTARVDLFDTHDNDSSTQVLGDTSERGWAVTGAWRRPLTRHLDLRVEGLHIDSNRPSRELAAEEPRQTQTVLQSSLRLSF